MKNFGRVISYIFIIECILYVAVVFLCSREILFIITITHWLFFSFFMFMIAFNSKKFFVITLARVFRWLIPIELIGWSGEIYYSLANKHTMTSAVYWFNDVGQITLLSNGLVSEASESSYIKFWLPLKKSERVEHILKNDLPDFQEILSNEDENYRIVSILRAYQHLMETAI